MAPIDDMSMNGFQEGLVQSGQGNRATDAGKGCAEWVAGDMAEGVSEPILAARAMHAQIFGMLGLDMDRTISATLVMEAEKAPVITVKRFVSTAGRKPITMQLQVEQFEVSRRIVVAGCDVQADAVRLTSANRFEVVKTSETTEVITIECVERVVVGSSGRCNTCGESVLWTAPLSTSHMRGRCACGIVSPQARQPASPPLV